jgi:hypothetical protein
MVWDTQDTPRLSDAREWEKTGILCVGHMGRQENTAFVIGRRAKDMALSLEFLVVYDTSATAAHYLV